MLLFVKTCRMYNINSNVNYGLEGVDDMQCKFINCNKYITVGGYIGDPVCDTNCLAVHTACTVC